MFNQWRNTPALDSPLEKNQDLKSVMLEETPWLRQAKNESQARRNVGILFENQRLTNETQAAMRKLREMQFPTEPGRGCPADVRAIISPSTSPPASAGCGRWMWISMPARPSKPSTASTIG